MEHICHFPRSFCCISFDCMSEGIHTCGSCQSLWHGGHHFRINNCDDWHVMWVNAYKFTFSFYICDNIINSYLCCCTCCCRNCNDRYTRFPGRSCTFQTSYVFEFRVCNNNTDCFGSVHRRTTADCDQIIRFRILKCLNTVLYVLDCRVRFDV